jgi:ornithine cyclodeaminase/alanine dehydrogenase
VKTRILTRADVERCLDMEAAVGAVEAAFTAHGRGETQMPVKVYVTFPEHDGDLRAMPSVMGDAAGVKWVNAHPRNPERHGLPSVMGVYVLSDPATAFPLAVMDATLLTAYRTGAAAGVASKHLARGDARTLGLIGCGVQARFFWRAHEVVRDGLEVVCADVDPERAEALARETGGRAAPLAEAAGCDIVCTATPVRTPIIMAAMVHPGAHLNAMGADAHGKQECEAPLLKRARVFVDDWEQAGGSGEVNVPLETGAITRDDIAGTIGEVTAGLLAGREDDGQVTLFDSTGLAIQDVALARVVYEAACAQGIGLELDLVGVGA